MTTFKLLVVLLLFMIIPDNRFVDGQTEFDHYTLALQWPTTFCSLNDCKRTPPPIWIVHGLWPTSANAQKPSDQPHYCGGQPFNLTHIEQKVLTWMSKHWPNLKNTNAKFWRYQWEKHGTCANLKINDYFLFVKLLVTKINMREILEKAKIKYNKTYQISKIEAKVRDFTKKRAQSVSIKKTLLEIRICFNRTFTYTDCTHDSHGGFTTYPSPAGPKTLKLSSNGHHLIPQQLLFVLYALIFYLQSVF